MKYMKSSISLLPKQQHSHARFGAFLFYFAYKKVCASLANTGKIIHKKMKDKFESNWTLRSVSYIFKFN